VRSNLFLNAAFLLLAGWILLRHAARYGSDVLEGRDATQRRHIRSLLLVNRIAGWVAVGAGIVELAWWLIGFVSSR